ncbi:MAG: hypothetical protein GVY19_07780 [Bacteroidetes bacterium]|jgi:predicted lipoprotein|nr:hypothetical protein [Bacteroidota bacterium]
MDYSTLSISHTKTDKEPGAKLPGTLRLISRFFFILTVCLFTITSCEDEETNTGSNEFDRSTMLANYAHNIIIPNYATLNNAVDSLNKAINNFTSSPDTVKLQQLREAWYNVAMNWQHCSTFEFGPASDVLLRASMNTFPTNVDQINDNISWGSYNLETAGNIDAIGLPALDYLINGVGEDDESIVSMYMNNDQSENRKQYLADLAAQMQSKVSAVYNDWVTDGGNYQKMFIASDGMDIGSSVGLLVNELNFDFEIIKNAKIGIPLGEKTLGSPLPQHVEAFYHKQSVDFAVEHIKAIDNIFNGRSRAGIDSTGLDDNLNALDAKHSSGIPLAEAINNQFDDCISAVESIPDPLSEAVENNSTVVDAAHTELKKQVVLLKTDLPSTLSVLITYQDNDGD